MTGKRLSELPSISSVTGAELVYVVDPGGISRQSNLNALLDLLEDIVQTDALQKDQNLSDLTNPSAARTNLGLGTIATQDADAVDITGGNLDGVDIGSVIPSNGIFEDVTITDNLIVIPGTTVSFPTASIDVDALTGQIPNTLLENDTINIVYGTALGGDATVELGGTLTLTFDAFAIPEIDGGDF